MNERERDDQGRPRNARPRDALGRPLPREATHTLRDEPPPANEDEALTRGVVLFNNGRFFEAHETWEYAWHPSSEPERDFWQGLIQVAVGFTHFQRGNLTGSVTLLRRGATKLQKYGAHHRGVPVRDIASAAMAAADDVERNGAEASPVPPTIELR